MGDYDVAILGLGTAGAAAAATLSAAGARVLGLESGPLDQAGARWVNDVPRWCLEQSGLGLPKAPEHRGEGAAFHMVAGWDGARVCVTGHQIVELDMRALGDRLRAAALEGGAELVGETQARGVEGHEVHTEKGRFKARWILDASGLAGARLLQRARPKPVELCSAAQEVREVTDPAAARDWFQARGVPPGDILCFTGIAGGYSVLRVRLEGDEVGLLSGSITALGNAAGKQIISRFVADNPWIGQRVFGGARAIPLHAPFARLNDGATAAIGDAGGQVFAIHGSGIGIQLVTARLLADTLAAGGDLAAFNLAWQRRHGGLFAGAALFARFSAALSTDAVDRLIRSGLMAPGVLRDGLDQKVANPRLADLPGLAMGAAREPGLLRILAPILVRMKSLEAHHSRFPEDPTAFDAWNERRERLLSA